MAPGAAAASTSTADLDAVARQVRDVRRRRNALELQRALFLAIAVAAATAAGLVGLALLAAPVLFVAAGVALVLAAIAVASAIARSAARRWLPARAAPRWIDRTAMLEGRLSSLLEVGRRDAFFVPLLAAQTMRTLPSWTPARLVPRAVPWSALAVALAATATFVGLLALAPALEPVLPEVEIDGRAVGGDAVTLPVPPARVVLSPEGDGGTGGEATADDTPGFAGGPEPREQGLLGMAIGWQSRIRANVWGDRWQRAAAALARAERAHAVAPPGGSAPRSDPERTGDERWPTARLPVGGAGRSTANGSGTAPGRWVEATDAVSVGEPSPREGSRNGGSGVGEGTSGAGDGTDTALFGPPSETAHADGDAFALAITARVRSPRAGPRPPSGEPPPVEADARPALADGQRRQLPVTKMPIPPAWEPLLRALFAHGGNGEEP
jgi:hypothetical protein